VTETCVQSNDWLAGWLAVHCAVSYRHCQPIVSGGRVHGLLVS